MREQCADYFFFRLLQRLTAPSTIWSRAARCSQATFRVVSPPPCSNNSISTDGQHLRWAGEEGARVVCTRRRTWEVSGLANGNADGRGPSGPGPQFGDARAGGAPGPGLQNFYASQRHQSSRGSNEAEQMMQAKRRMAAQRERELRNYHQEQQYNRSRPPSVV